jgi:hypothetical protein
MVVLRQVTLMMLWRAKGKHRKAAGSPNTGAYSGDRERSEAQALRSQSAVNVA